MIKRERGGIDDAVAILGLKKRNVEDKAASGKIPGAVKIGKLWTFNLQVLRDFVRDAERKQCLTNEQRHHPAVTGAAIFSGASLKSAGGGPDGLYKQTIRNLRRSGAKRARLAPSPMSTATPSGASLK
jgi:hypothetical protein